MSKSLFFAATMLAASPVLAAPQDGGSVKDEIQALKERLAELEQRLAEKEQEEKEKVVVVEKRKVSEDATVDEKTETRTVAYDTGVHARLDKLEKKTEENENWPIKIHGAVRFQYEYNDYNSGNENRGGDLDFDIFRLNFDGEIGDVILSAEYRWFHYMDVVKHA